MQIVVRGIFIFSKFYVTRFQTIWFVHSGGSSPQHLGARSHGERGSESL